VNAAESRNVPERPGRRTLGAWRRGSNPSGQGPSATGGAPGTYRGNRGRNIYLAVLVLGTAALLQGTVVARIRFFGVSPNLMLVIVVAWSLLRGVTEGLVWAFAGGLALDLMSGIPLGTSSLALMTACLLAGLGTNQVFATNLLFPILIVSLATAVAGWLVLLISQIRGLPLNWIASTVHIIGPELLLNAALMVLIYPALRWVTERPRATPGSGQ
jgi:rod shape-determining protein MreD